MDKTLMFAQERGGGLTQDMKILPGSVCIELDLAKENYESCLEDVAGKRLRRATTGLYFALEHLAKALLASIDVAVDQPDRLANIDVDRVNHESVAVLLGFHFIRTGGLPPFVGRHLGNLYERRCTAELTSRAGWEFTEEEVATYLGWFQASSRQILEKLVRSVSELRTEINVLRDVLAVNPFH